MPLSRPTDLLRRMGQAVDAKGDYFPGHSEGVVYFAHMAGLEGGLTTEAINRLQLAALVHDIGKLMIPDHILGASRRLTPEEFDVMKTHSEWGAEILKRTYVPPGTVEAVLHHHEHFDGSGYPDGLEGNRIPLFSRIMLVADAFHVMTTDRPYQPARTRSEAAQELASLAGKQFCPTAVDWFLTRNSAVPESEFVPRGSLSARLLAT